MQIRYQDDRVEINETKLNLCNEIAFWIFFFLEISFLKRMFLLWRKWFLVFS